MLIPLPAATVDVSTETGYLFVRIGGFVQYCKLTPDEVAVLVGIQKLFNDHDDRSDRASEGRGTATTRARSRAAGATA